MNTTKTQGSRPAIGPVLRMISNIALLSASCLAMNCPAAQAQGPTAVRQAAAGSELPAIQITAPEARQHAHSTPAPHAAHSSQRRRAVAARRVEPQAPPTAAFAESQ